MNKDYTPILVLDQNAVSNPDYLNNLTERFMLAITDEFLAEAMKGNPGAGLRETSKKLKKYVPNIYKIKSIRSIMDWELKNGNFDIQDIIDYEATDLLRRTLLSGEHGFPADAERNNTLDEGFNYDEHFRLHSPLVDEFRRLLVQYKKKKSVDDEGIIKDELRKFITKSTWLIFEDGIRKKSEAIDRLTFESVTFTYLLAFTYVSIERALNGGTIPGRKKLVNDNIDTCYLAYALCLNGIATNEERVIDRYKNINKIQEEIIAIADTICPMDGLLDVLRVARQGGASELLKRSAGL